MIKSPLPLLGFAAYSGTGKTTLIEQVIPLLKASGIRIAMIKQTHHKFDIDKPGKDSYRLRKAGANQMLVGSINRWALMVENPQPKEPDLEQLIQQLDHTQADLILVEGFKYASLPKIELNRPSLGKDFIYPTDENVIAVATDQAEAINTTLPKLDINNPQAIAGFIKTTFTL